MSTTDNAGAQSLQHRTAAAVMWTMLQKWLVRISGLATIAILTRLLTPEDFGVVAVASTIIPLLYLLADLGFSAYLIQIGEVNKRILSTAFWFSITAGVLLSLGLTLAAPLLAILFSAPELSSILPVMSLAVILVTGATVPTAIIRRNMDFRALAIQTAVATVLAQVVAIVTAFSGWGAWALVAQLLTFFSIVGILVWIRAKWLPSLQFSLPEFKAMARFGGNVVGVELVTLSRTWAETAIVAAVLGVTGVGYLNVAQRLVQVAQDLSVAAITSVTSVAFAKVKTSIERLRAGYVRALELTFAAATLPMVFIATGASHIVPILFGEGWERSVVPAQVLAVAAIMVAGSMVDHSFFYGIGKPHTWFRYVASIDIIVIAVTLVTVQFGLNAVTTGFASVAFIGLLVRAKIVSRTLQTRFLEVIQLFGRPAVTGLIGAVISVAAFQLSANLPPLAALAIAGVSLTGVYLVVGRFTMPKSAILIRNFLNRRGRAT